jgi:hypothetical protein
MLNPLFWQRFGNRICYCDGSGEPMRFVKTLLIQLYIDTETPERVCGKLQVLPDRKFEHFQSDAALMDLLKRLALEPAQGLSPNDPPKIGNMEN